MPIERISKGFKDISLSFSKNSLTGDIVVLKNETAISRSIRNLVSIKLNEIYFSPQLGVNRILFENIDDIILSDIKDRIESIIQRYEPRVRLLSTLVDLKDFNNELNITVRYQIVGIEVPSQQLEFPLLSTR